MWEEDEQLLLPDTTWPFTGPCGSTLAYEVEHLAHQLDMDFFDRRFRPSYSGALEYNPNFKHNPSPLRSLLLFLGGRAFFFLCSGQFY